MARFSQSRRQGAGPGRRREAGSEGPVFAPAKPAFPPSLVVKLNLKQRDDEQKPDRRRDASGEPRGVGLMAGMKPTLAR